MNSARYAMDTSGRRHRTVHSRISTLRCLPCRNYQSGWFLPQNTNRFPQTFFPWTRINKRHTKKPTVHFTDEHHNIKQQQQEPEQFDPDLRIAVRQPLNGGVLSEALESQDLQSNINELTSIIHSSINDALSTLSDTQLKPEERRVAKLIDLFESGKVSCWDQSNPDLQQQNPTVPLTKDVISEPTGGKKLVPDGHPTASGNYPSPNDWQAKDFGDVVLRIQDSENKYERSKRYKSIFTDAPLYQVYSENVARNQSIREARRRQGARQALAKVSHGTHATGVNSLEFDESMFEAIDKDEQEYDNQIFTSGSPDPFAPDTSNDQTFEWDSGALTEAAFDQWKRAASLRASSRSTGSQSRKSPPIVDNRTRVRSPERMGSPARSESQNRTSPSPTRTRHPASTVETKSFAQKIAGTGPNRVMWCNMPQVVSAGLATGLTSLEKKLQEALFEIITSEASYYRSLNVLIEVFYKASCMQPDNPDAVVTHTQKHHLFSNILEINLTSENFLSAMEACFHEDPMLKTLCEIVYEHADSQFETYVPYVQNQMYQTRTLCKLLEVPAFAEAVKNLQSNPLVGCLDMNSFLLLPLQRVTRLRLLVATVLNYAPQNTVVYQTGLVALAALEKVLAACEAKKSYMEQKERLVDLCTRFDYKMDAKSLALDSRRLIKEGELRLITVQRVMGSAFHRKFSSIMRQKVVNASLFLFNDMLVIAKKRSNQRFMVDEHCPLSWIRVEVDPGPQDANITKYFPAGTYEASTEVDTGGDAKTRGGTHSVESKTTNAFNGHESIRRENEPFKRAMSISNEPGDTRLFSFRLIIEAPEHPRAVYNLQANSLSERERWVDAISPSRYGIANNLFTKVLDCPQVLITRSHSTNVGDELELKEGDQLSLLVSVMDVGDKGWCKGMLAKGNTGWFPTGIFMEVKDKLMKRENMRNFMLLEEARAAYGIRKAREQLGEFPRCEDLNRSRRN